jgi:catechol 2,3-dioxygenase-like lactoylglutathione lyase family enzyme
MAKLRHLALVVNDLEASAGFYERIFDLKRVYESTGRAIYLTDGLMNLALLSSANTSSGSAIGAQASGISHFGFRIADFASVEVALAAAGATFSHDLGDPNGMNYERKWRDPEGILFDVSEKGWYGACEETAPRGTVK